MLDRMFRKLAPFAVVAMICIALGIFSANYASTRSRYGEFRMNEDLAQPCPEEMDEILCLNIPVYNPNSSGGFEGYPLVSDKYYCTDDAHCRTITQINTFGGIGTKTVNRAIFAALYLLLFMAFLWLRSRVQHNKETQHHVEVDD